MIRTGKASPGLSFTEIRRWNLLRAHHWSYTVHKHSNMFNQYEVPAYILDELPEIRDEFEAINLTTNIFKSLQCLASYTCHKIKVHDHRMVKRCLRLGESIYCKGNSMVRDAVENVFVYSFSAFMGSCNRQERKHLQSLMPLSLHTVYVQQVLKSGI